MGRSGTTGTKHRAPALRRVDSDEIARIVSRAAEHITATAPRIHGLPPSYSNLARLLAEHLREQGHVVHEPHSRTTPDWDIEVDEVRVSLKAVRGRLFASRLPAPR
jgi:hypothetical protein